MIIKWTKLLNTYNFALYEKIIAKMIRKGVPNTIPLNLTYLNLLE